MLLGRHQSSPRLLHRWWWRHNWLRIWNCMTSIQETLEIQTRKCNQHNMKLQRKKKRRTREKMCFDFSIRFSQPFFSDISISYDVISHKIRRQEEQEWHLKQTRRREGFWTRETNRDKTREWPSSLFKRKQAVVKEKRAGSGRTSMTMTTRGGKRRSAHKTWSVRKESKILWDNNNSISRLTLKSSERLNKGKKEWKKKNQRKFLSIYKPKDWETGRKEEMKSMDTQEKQRKHQTTKPFSCFIRIFSLPLDSGFDHVFLSSALSLEMRSKTWKGKKN